MQANAVIKSFAVATSKGVGTREKLYASDAPKGAHPRPEGAVS